VVLLETPQRRGLERELAARAAGLARQELLGAPRRIASTASGTLPCPVQTTICRLGSIASSSASACMPGRCRSSRIASGDCSRTASSARSARVRARTWKPIRRSSPVHTVRRLWSSSTSSKRSASPTVAVVTGV
jgi:hypothetical protein